MFIKKDEMNKQQRRQGNQYILPGMYGQRQHRDGSRYATKENSQHNSALNNILVSFKIIQNDTILIKVTHLKKKKIGKKVKERLKGQQYFKHRRTRTRIDTGMSSAVTRKDWAPNHIQRQMVYDVAPLELGRIPFHRLRKNIHEAHIRIELQFQSIFLDCIWKEQINKVKQGENYNHFFNLDQIQHLIFHQHMRNKHFLLSFCIAFFSCSWKQNKWHIS